MSQIVPAPDDPGCFVVVNGDTEQSFIDPADPTRLEFEYVQRIAEILDEAVLSRPASEKVRLLHIGGGGFTLPRYVEARRPGTAQIVMEPDVELSEQIRRQFPLPGRATTKVLDSDGLSGMRGLPSGSMDAIIIDAFSGAQVPAELAAAGAFAEATRLLRSSGVLVMNLTDTAPFDWARRCIAGLVNYSGDAGVIAETSVWKGRRFGNLIAVGGIELPVAAIARRVAAADFPHRVIGGHALLDWLDGAAPFTAQDAQPSPLPDWGKTWFGPARRHK